MIDFDVIVIGSGPGGYVSAIRSAQLGMKTALVEKYNTLGGTCLNVGCIPSKALLDSSEHYHNAKANFETHGIKVGKLEVDFPQMIARKKQVVDQTCDGIDYLMKKNKVEVFHGTGSFKSANEISVATDGEPILLKGKHIIIATGSKPIELPFAKFDKERIISSTEALSLPELPKSMVVIGGGVIGLELGSVYARLGTEVTVVEYADGVLPTMDAALGKELMRSMKKLGVQFLLSTKVTDVSRKGKFVTVKATDKKDKPVELKADICLVAVGRRAYTDGLNADAIGLKRDERGKIEIDNHFRTNVPNVYAIGDVVKGAMLAHKAEEEGVVLAEMLAGQKPHIDYNLIPNVVYTWPEVAAVGKTEAELKSDGVPYKTGQFPMRALGRSRASGDIDGLVKILAHKDTDEVLGVHIVAARAADLIMEAAVAMEFRASAEDISRICHGHPTYSEAVKEAALAATGDRALHI
jgi:dihydrolipoamide dehydrogenase